MIALPDPNGGHAYNSNGNIAMFNRIDGDLTVFLHETGHSLDGLGAYADTPFHDAKTWIDNYNLDSNTADPYAQSSQVENMAQITVVAVYNEVIPFGFSTVEKNYMGIFHQYATLQTEADKAGNILKSGGSCTHRLQNSNPVTGGAGKKMRRSAAGLKPDVSLKGNVTVIQGKQFDTSADCKHSW